MQSRSPGKKVECLEDKSYLAVSYTGQLIVRHSSNIALFQEIGAASRF